MSGTSASVDDEARRDDARGGATRIGRLDRFQRRHRLVGFPIGVLYKYVDDQGNYLAALVAFYAFLSFLPLLLLLAAILGLVLRGNDEAQESVLHSALSQFPVIGQDLADPQTLGGGIAGLVVGILVSLYGAMGVANALQNAMNVAWGVPRRLRPNPIAARLRSVWLILLGALSVLGTTVLSALGSNAKSYGASSVGDGLALGLTFVSVAVNAVLFVALFRFGAARRLRIREVAAGALMAAAAWQALQYFGTFYVATVIKHASALNGVFALMLGLIGFLFLEAIAVVAGIEVNVVRVRRLYPRALLSPFTDDVALTAADEKAYASYAHAQQHKSFEQIEISFTDRLEEPADGGQADNSAGGSRRDGEFPRRAQD